jgi:hypothetical protein
VSDCASGLSPLWLLVGLVGITCALMLAALATMAGDRTGMRERAEDKVEDKVDEEG